ncbi:hypothetical protein [Mucilaginibacter sp. SJ]|uniref:hypothetical protein n=1 Tax=Mucilaginibacter sp. SJ TaxID=3029053 RepID=UPI0023A9764A|nr:hypothetical protein [Mucilaginibacter sp. SJ]WEA01623.1 hypothetical protein MusilaSJ_01630 [Mucilaginibacter sp. SJ]
MLKLQLDNRPRRVSLAVIVFTAVIFIIGTSLKSGGVKSLIWIEAESAEKVVEPLRIIDMEGASEKKGIIAIGNHFRKEGYAKYKFAVEQDGDYTVWGRCFWDNVCTNSFQIGIDNLGLEGIGEDPLTNQWHWVMGPKFKIKRGEHTLYLWNREASSQIDKMLITADPTYVPEGTGIVSSISEDFETGLIPENFSFLNKSDWKIVDGSAKSKNLFHATNSTGGYLGNQVLIHQDYGASYLFSLAFKANKFPRKTVSVSFNYQNELNFCEVRIDGRAIKLIETRNGHQKILQQKSFNENLINDEFRDLSVCSDHNTYNIKYNGNDIFRFAVNPLTTGDIVGFGSSAGVYFDNISLNGEQKISYNENFHEPDFSASTEKPETSAGYLQNLKRGRRNWWIIDGQWNQTTLDGYEEIGAKSSSGKPALIVFGTDFWKNYEIQVATRFNSENGAGIIFNFHDRNNYSLFRWIKGPSGWKYLIDRIQSGKETPIAATIAINPKKGLSYWYKVNLRIKDDSIKVLIGDKIVLQKKSKMLEGDGKVGFWSMGEAGAYFDDILVSSIKNLSPVPESPMHVYNLFTAQLDISTSYSYWLPAKDSIIIKQPTGIFICLNKPMFEPAFIYNTGSFKTDFKISLASDGVPRDIDANLNFKVNTKEGNADYNFIIANDKITVTKNAQVIFIKNYNSSARTDIHISHIKNVWEIVELDKKVASFTDKTQWDTTKIGVGYSGVGQAKVILQHIEIENL